MSDARRDFVAHHRREVLLRHGGRTRAAPLRTGRDTHLVPLRLPLLQAIGGLLLLLIAVRLLMDRSSAIHEQSTEHLGPPQEGERGAAAATKGFKERYPMCLKLLVKLIVLFQRLDGLPLISA